MQQIAFILFGWTRHLTCNRPHSSSLDELHRNRWNKYHSSSLDELHILDETNCIHVIFGFIAYAYQCWAGIIFDTLRIRFSQNKLQKIKILAFEFFLKKTYALGQGINILIKNWTDSHDVSSHKFENRRLSFGGSHQPVIPSFSKLKKIKITTNYLFSYFSFKFLKNHIYP